MFVEEKSFLKNEMKKYLIIFVIVGVIFISEIQTVSAITIDTTVVVNRIKRYSRDSIDWIDCYFEKFDYNSMGLVTLHSGRTVLSDYLFTIEREYEGSDTLYYDAYNRLIKRHSRGQEKKYSITKFEYSVDNKLLKKLYYIRFDDDSIPKSNGMIKYVYLNNNLTYTYFYKTDSDTLTPEMRTFYQYSGKLLHSTINQYFKNLVWIDSTTTTYEYSKTGKISHLLNVVNFDQHKLNEEWYEYNNADLLIYYKWVQNYFQGEYKYEYNDDGKLIYEETNSPLGITKAKYFYENNKLDSLLYSFMGDYKWNTIASKYIYQNNLLIQEIQKFDDERYWENNYKFAIIDYEYRKITENREYVELKKDISLSPNPASDFIEISVGEGSKPASTSDIKIINLFGQNVFSVGAVPELPQRIDVSQLPPGLYFVRIGDKIQKFVKM